MTDNNNLPAQFDELNQIKKEISDLYQAFVINSSDNSNKTGTKRARQALTALNKVSKRYKDITKSFKTILQKDLINAKNSKN